MVKDAPRAKPIPKPAPDARGGRRRAVRVVGRLFRRMIQALMLGVVFSAALAYGWLRSTDFQTRSIRVAVAMLEAELGEEVRIGRIDVGLWPPKVDVDEVDIWSRTTGVRIVGADRIRVPLALTMRGPRIGRLELIRPSVALHITKDGKLAEFRDRARRGGGGKLKELPFVALKVTRGIVPDRPPRGRPRHRRPRGRAR